MSVIRLTRAALDGASVCSTSCERRRSVSVPIFAASPLSLAASPLKCAPPRNRSATLLRGCSKDFAKAFSGVPGAGGDAPATSFQGLLKEAKGADGLTNRACYILPKRTG
jgi:hypothetical protein